MSVECECGAFGVGGGGAECVSERLQRGVGVGEQRGEGVCARPMLPTDPLSERGRGQFIIAHLARAFDIRTDERGRTVYDVVLDCEHEFATAQAPA